jgi:glycerophosphoryl diester phosphodiesterase
MGIVALTVLACSSESDPRTVPSTTAPDAAADAAIPDAASGGSTADGGPGDAGGAGPAPTPFVTGHRGGALEVPENTLAAFARAIGHGVNPEMDVRLSSDGHVVVIHDDTVDRTTDGSGAVASMTLAELQALDAGSHFAAQYAGEPIPTLDQVLAQFAATAPAGMILSIDTKVESDTMYDGLIDSLGAHDLLDRAFVEVSSPSIGDALQARPGGSAVRLAIWVGSDAQRFDEALGHAPLERVHCSATLAARADEAQGAGKTLHPGLINDESDWSVVSSHPIDGIISDAPVHLAEQVIPR